LTGEDLRDKSGVRLIRIILSFAGLKSNKSGAEMSGGSMIKGVMRAVIKRSSHEKVSADLSFF
jgi:hypothetical protein